MSQSTEGKSKKWTVQKRYCEKMLISIGSFPTLNIANLVALIAYEMKSNNDDQPWKHLRGVFYWQNMQLTR